MDSSEGWLAGVSIGAVNAAIIAGNPPPAPVAMLPVREVISGTHVLSDLTLGLGGVVYDHPDGDRRTR